MQYDEGAMHGVEDAEVEKEDRGFGEEDRRVVYNIDDVVKLLIALVLEGVAKLKREVHKEVSMIIMKLL